MPTKAMSVTKRPASKSPSSRTTLGNPELGAQASSRASVSPGSGR